MKSTVCRIGVCLLIVAAITVYWGPVIGSAMEDLMLKQISDGSTLEQKTEASDLSQGTEGSTLGQRTEGSTLGQRTEGLTPEQKLEDFEYLYRVISENYPFLWVNERVNGVDWLEQREEFQELISETRDDEEFRRVIAYVLSCLNNGHTHLLSSSSFTSPPSAEVDNVTTAILEEGRVAYIRIGSFSGSRIEADRQQVLEFLSSVREYPNLLIDIRGNGGGSDAYWIDLLVSPLISRPVAWTRYLAVRSGDLVQDYMKSRLGPGYYFLQVGRCHLPGLQNVPKEVFSEHFSEPIQLPSVVMPKDSVGFQGRIVLLVDERVYSASESFAAFAKATGWATLVGTVTGGDGLGFDPVIFALPNSGLRVRMSDSMGLNPDGTANEEAKTVPDVLVDKAGTVTTDPVIRAALALCIDKSESSRADSDWLGWVSWIGVIARGFTHRDEGLAELTAGIDFSQYDGQEIESVKIYGAYKTDEELVRRIVCINAGDVFSADTLRAARRRLSSTGALRSVALFARPAADGKVEVVVFVQEGWSLYLSPREIGRRSIEDALSNRVSLNAYNLGGRLINLRTVYGFGQNGMRSIRAEGPVFIRTIPWVLAVTGETATTRARLVAGEHSGSEYAVRTSGASLEAKTVLSESLAMSVKLAYLGESVLNLASNTGLTIADGAYTDLSIAVAGRRNRSADLTTNAHWASSITGSWQVTAGVAVDASGEAWTPYGHASAQATALIGLPQSRALVLDWIAAAMDSSAPASRWYLLGGDQAFPEYPRGLLGHTYFSANAEWRHYVTQDMSIGAMAGAGKVWDVPGKYGLDDLMIRAGVVAKYMTPLSLTLEMRYTWSIDRDQERFSFGIIW